MSGVMKAALVTLLLNNKCSIVRVEEPTETTGWWVVFEMDSPVGSRIKNFGAGQTECEALIDALKRSGAYTLKTRLFLLEFMVEHLANRAGPALLRSIENGR
jgi:hypothetical protein